MRHHKCFIVFIVLVNYMWYDGRMISDLNNVYNWAFVIYHAGAFFCIFFEIKNVISWDSCHLHTSTPHIPCLPSTPLTSLSTNRVPCTIHASANDFLSRSFAHAHLRFLSAPSAGNLSKDILWEQTAHSEQADDIVGALSLMGHLHRVMYLGRRPFTNGRTFVEGKICLGVSLTECR